MNFLISKFAELSAQFRFRFFVQHIDGKENEVADALSRFKNVYQRGYDDISDFEFISAQRAIDIANEFYGCLLDIRIVPFNDGDPKLFR